METQLRGEASLEGLSNKAVQCQNYLTIIAKLTKLTYSMFLPLQCKKQLVMGLSILQIQLKFLRYAFQMYFQGIAKLSEDQMLHYEFQTYFQGITKLSELINWCSINFRYNYFQPKDNISNNIPMY